MLQVGTLAFSTLTLDPLPEGRGDSVSLPSSGDSSAAARPGSAAAIVGRVRRSSRSGRLARALSPRSGTCRSTTSPTAPSAAHWLGTDALGKDVLSRVMFGSRLSLAAGCLSIVLAVALGAPLGAIAGYFGGRVDSLLMRAIDVALAFPSVLIALLVSAAYGPSWATVVIAVGLINVPVFARQVRATVLSVAQLEYVLASRAFGATSWHVVTREILPSLVSPSSCWPA